MSRGRSGRRSALRNTTRGGRRISLSVSWALRASTSLQPARAAPPGESGGDFGAFEMLVGGAVVAFGQRCALAGLALARGRVAVGDAPLERAGLDLLLDEEDCRADPFVYGPGNLSLNGDRKVATDVLEKGTIRLREVVRVGGEALHRALARGQDLATVLELRRRVGVRIDQVLDRAIDRS